jgi:hypothetical protein
MLARMRCGKISLGAHAASSGDDESSPTSPDECSAPSDDGFNDELLRNDFTPERSGVTHIRVGDSESELSLNVAGSALRRRMAFTRVSFGVSPPTTTAL